MPIQENRPTETPKPKRILVVDPDPVMQELLRDVLDGYSIERKVPLAVDTADSIVSALNKLKPDETNVDLLLMDWKLPDGTGGSLLGLNDIQRPPTLVVSGREMRPANIIDPQIKGVLPKPFDMDELFNSIDPILKNKQQP